MKRTFFLSATVLFMSIGLFLHNHFYNRVLAQQNTDKVNDQSEMLVQLGDLVVQLGHSAPITSAAFSPDGRLALTGSVDSTARLWDVSTGQELRRFLGHTGIIHSVAFSPDGSFVLTGSGDRPYPPAKNKDNTARLWDAATGEEVRRFLGHASSVNSVAFSPDGKLILTGSWDHTARLWDTATGKELKRFENAASPVAYSPNGQFIAIANQDNTVSLYSITTGEEVKRFIGHSSPVNSLAFSPDGQFVLTGSGKYEGDNTARLWDTATGREIKRFVGHTGGVYTVAFSPDGRFVLTGGIEYGGKENSTARLWNGATGEEIRRFATKNSDYIASVAYSPDGRFILTACGESQGQGSNNIARLWDVATGEEMRRFEGIPSYLLSAAYSPDGRFIVTGNGSQNNLTGNYAQENFASLWDLTTGQEARRFIGHLDWINSVAFSPDSRFVLTGGGRNFRKDDNVRVWDTATGEELRRFTGHTQPEKKFTLPIVSSVAYSPDGRFLLTGGYDGTARLWDAATGAEVRRFVGQSNAMFKEIYSVAFSPDGRSFLTGSNDGTARLWDTATGQEVRQFSTGPGGIPCAAYSPDGKFVLTGHTDNIARLWDPATGTIVRNFVGHSHWIMSVAFSPDGRFALTGSFDGTARIWDVATGKEVRRFSGSIVIKTAVFSPDSRFVLTAGADNTLRLWDAATGEELCKLISFSDGGWVVVASDGRFDTNNLEEIKGLHWVMPDSPFEPLPIEIFMREYYEPRLLGRIIEGEKFKPIRSLANLNRVQPIVKISKIESQPNSPATVAVTVEVSKAVSRFQHDKEGRLLETGVYDLRLFRDGQLVGYAPEIDGEVKTDPQTGKRSITFSNIKLPRKKDQRQVEFSAYGFNVDRVKSATDRRMFELPRELSPVKGRAYLITVGVNAYENSAWDLKFAANDARRIQKTFFEKLSQTGDYEEIVQLPLISDYEPEQPDSKPGKAEIRLIEKTATKRNIKAVFDLLSGKKVDPELIKALPNGEKIRQARPEDLVLISFSTHGYTDTDGTFYLIPYDTGQAKELTKDLLQRSISSDELSFWLKDVDAGEITMIVDACHSAAVVESKQFKPGPMGARGLGQLSYDKGIRVLTATQTYNIALEFKNIEQGLLTYALIHDGLESGQADFKPKDRIITMREWLLYAVERVPKLYEEVITGKLEALVYQEGSKRNLTKTSEMHLKVQQPSLFDFARKRGDVVIVKEP